MKQERNAVRGLMYKLRMIDIPMLGPSYIYQDIMLVVHNTSMLDIANS